MLTEIDYNYDREALVQEAMDQSGYKPFVDPKSGKVIDQWLIKKNMGKCSQRISDDFQRILRTVIKPRFYIQNKGFTLPWHRDRGTLSAVNFVLSTSRDPIEYRQMLGKHQHVRKFEYQNAIIDVQIEHQVRASTSKRILFKLSLPELDYYAARDRYHEYYDAGMRRRELQPQTPALPGRQP